MFWIRPSWILSRNKKISRSRICSKNYWRPKNPLACSILMTLGRTLAIWKICGKRKGDGRLQTEHRTARAAADKREAIPGHLPTNRVSIARIRQQGTARGRTDRTRLYGSAWTAMADLRKHPAPAARRHLVQKL